MARYDYYKKKVNKKKIVKDIILIYIVAVMFVMLFNSLILQAYRIPSNSMEPGIKEHTRVLVNKFSYGPKYPFTEIRIFDSTKNIKRGDVIVFMSEEYINRNKFFRFISDFVYTVTFSLVDLLNYTKHYDSNIYIKRVIGLPNDKIKYQLVNGEVVVLINGIPEKNLIQVGYEIIEETEKNSALISSLMMQNEYVVKEGEFYVLGDNRVYSSDSRIFGAIAKRQIIGKGILKYWPIPQFGIVK
ncbi:MAG: signal peptidase I [Spirochaetes bacterium GWD1_27_9]|nr:MAG: signal peptidase I [Spirochaetes bacterium GWB1_27_13]OHD21289.1 MAG: signal peptidase I [Spirochaetes bacterium GWC1_27_15]OHD41869.1 MAG: signal peptidase I [Spirochaetes bacterium GWD1_27_9]